MQTWRPPFVDVHNDLVCAVHLFPLTWKAAGVRVDEPDSVLRLAAGGHGIDPDRVDQTPFFAAERRAVRLLLAGRLDLDWNHVAGTSDEQDLADETLAVRILGLLSSEMRPSVVLSRGTLNGAAGAILLDAGEFPDRTAALWRLEYRALAILEPDSAPESTIGPKPTGTSRPHVGGLAIRNGMTLFGGQELVGVGAGDGGSDLVWMGGDGTVVDVIGANAAVRSLRIRSVRTGEGVAVRVRKANDVTIENVVVGRNAEDGTPIDSPGGGVWVDKSSRCVIRRCRIHATSGAVLFSPSATECRAIGSALRSASPAGGLVGSVVALDGKRCGLVRCRIEGPPAANGGDDAGDVPLVSVTGIGSAVLGCRFVASASGGPCVRIVAPPDAPIDGASNGAPMRASGTLLERNFYSANDADQAPTLVEDFGTNTLFRDVAVAGFPPVALSTYNLIRDGSFEEAAERLILDGMQVPGAWVPVGWPRGWSDRDAFEQARAHGALPGQGWSNGPYFGFGQQLTRPTFLGDGAVPGSSPDVMFEESGEVHHGRASLWLGVPPVSPPAHPGAATRNVLAHVDQVVNLDPVSRDYVLSGFIKARGAGSAAIHLSDGRGWKQALAYDGGGGWQQRTIRYQAPADAAGPIDLTVRCVVISGIGNATEAFFDRFVLVAGCVVPHFSEAVAADTGGPMPKSMPVQLGWRADARLDGSRFNAVSVAAGATLAMHVVPESAEMDGDLMISFARGSDRTTTAGILHVDVRRNGRSIFWRGHPSPVVVKSMAPDAVTACIPLDAVDEAHRRWSAGDLLSLHSASYHSVAHEVVIPAVVRTL